MKPVPEYSFEGNLQPEGEEDGLDIREYLQILFKYKWGIISIAFLAGLIGLYLAYKAVPVYASSATLQIERQGGPTIGDLLNIQTDQKSFYTTQYELLRSWGVAEAAADRLGLLDAAYLEGDNEAPEASGFQWRSLIPTFVLLPEPEVTPETRRVTAIEQIQKNLKVNPVRDSELVSISFDSTRPEWAAQQANAVAEAYIDFLRDKNLTDILGKQSWYSSRVEQSRHDLEAAENALQDFLDRQGLM
jgi:succinoglycan biosynthesis transport protein ExoP